MSEDTKPASNRFDATRRIISRATGGRAFTASYKPPVANQVKQSQRGEAWWRDFAWEEYSCFTPDTEILTSDGWKLIQDVKIAEEVATLSPEGKLVYQSVTQSFIKNDYDRGMIHFQSRGVDLMVTPNHKMVVRSERWKEASYKQRKERKDRYSKAVPIKDGGDWNYDNYRFVYAGDILDTGTVYEAKKDVIWEASKKETVHIEFNIPMRNGMAQLASMEFPTIPFVQLLGYYLSEGSVSDDRYVTLSQSNVAHHKDVKTKMAACVEKAINIIPRTTDKGVHFTHEKLGAWLHNLGYRAWDKRVPKFIFDLDSVSIRAFIEAYIEGDGYTHKSPNIDTPIIYTTSPHIRDAIQELAFKAGWAADWTTRTGGFSDRTQYVITIKKHNLHPKITANNKHQPKVTFVSYTGTIVCVSVPMWHTLYVRRNGKAVWSGNTQYLPGLGLAFSVYPYTAIWEKIWGAIPVEDYAKYKQYYSVHKGRILPLLMDGEPSFLTFEELWNYVALNHFIETDGFEEVIHLDADNIKTLSSKKDIHAKKDGIWKPLKLIVRHKYTGKLVRLQQRDGETIVTDNHSILDENFKECSPLSSPKLNSVRFIQNDIQQTSELVLEDETYQRVIERKMPKGGIAKIVYKARAPIARQMTGDKLEAFCRFLGAYVAEGNMKYRKRGQEKRVQYHYLEVHNTDRTWLEYISKQIQLFTISTPQIRSHIKKGTEMFTLYVTNNDLCYLVEKYCGIGAENKTIPFFIYKLEPRFKQAFLDEYSFGDGNRKLLQKGQYSGTSISPKLIAGMTYLFAQLNTVVAYNFNRGNQSYSIIQRSYLNDTYLSPHQDFVEYNDYVYDVEVADTHNFVDGIGFVVLRNTQEPFIRATIDLHTMMAFSQGYEIDYPIETVVSDMKQFLDRHDFLNGLKILGKDVLTFGNSYIEVVRLWICPETGHNLDILRISYEEINKQGLGWWWTDRMDVVAKHNEMYPEHRLENPYGEIVRLKYLDPSYMRVRRDAYGTVLGYVQWYMFPLVTLLADEIIHLRYMPSSWTYESVYGVSMLRPILFHQELVKGYEQTMGQIMNIYLKPMFIVKVGNPNSPTGEVRTDQYNQVVQAFARRKPGTDIIVKSGGVMADVQPIQAPINSLQASAFWLKWLHDMRTFALTVPKFFVDPHGLNRACHASDTKALTRSGWKYHYEVEANEEIMVFDPKTNAMHFELPKQLQAYRYEGDMIHFKTSLTDLLVTPEHTIIYKTSVSNDWKVKEAQALPKTNVLIPVSAEWEGTETEYVEIPQMLQLNGARPSVMLQSIRMKMDSFLELAGFYVSEGGMDSKNHYLWNVDGKQICDYMESQFGEGHLNKFISPVFKNLSKRQLRILFDAFMKGDGAIDTRPNRTSMAYYTTSERLANDVAEIAFKLGYASNIITTQDTRPNRSIIFRVLINTRKTSSISQNKISRESYNGTVYCFATSTGFYPVMRNGKISIAGNTAQVVQEAYFTFITSLRQSLSSQVERELFPKIMHSLYGETADILIGEYGYPKFIWKPVREESLSQKTPTVLDLFKARVIGLNEARTMLGFKPLEKDDIADLGLGMQLPGVTTGGMGGHGGTNGMQMGGTGGDTFAPTVENSQDAQAFQELIQNELSSTDAASGDTDVEEGKTEEFGINDDDDITDDKLSDIEDWIDDMRSRIKTKRESRFSEPVVTTFDEESGLNL